MDSGWKVSFLTDALYKIQGKIKFDLLLHLPGFGSKRDGLGQLSASQIASLHTTVQLQHKNNHHQQQNLPQSSLTNQHQVPSSYPPPEIFHKSPMALSEHEISRVSRTTNAPGDTSISHMQNPLESSRTSHHAVQHGATTHNAPGDIAHMQNLLSSRTSNGAMQHGFTTNNAPPSQLHSFRERGLLSGAQPIRLQQTTSNSHAVQMRDGGMSKVGDFYSAQASGLGDELATLEQDPDRSFGESFVDGRGYASGEFLPLKAVNTSPSKCLCILEFKTAI